MLRSLTESDLPEAVRFSECLLRKPESQSYPLFQSPAEIEAEFRLRLCDANRPFGKTGHRISRVIRGRRRRCNPSRRLGLWFYCAQPLPAV